MTTRKPAEYDIVVVGAGPAGLAAGLYAARARRRTLMLEKGVVGGQISLTSTVENYPGAPEVQGLDLAQTMLKQAESYGLETAYEAATAIEPSDDRYVIKTAESEYRAKAVVLTGGADYNRLGVPGEERLTGRGVSYCATCDGAFFAGMEVAVVGGGDSAVDEALFLTRYASSVTIIHRRGQLRASAILQERAFGNDKIRFRWNTIVTAIEGEEAVTSLRLRDVVTSEETAMPFAGVFVFIGQTPNSAYLEGLVDVDEGGHVLVNEWMETKAPGLFAAGDIRSGSARQAVSAAGDGATAAIRADRYISERFRD